MPRFQVSAQPKAQSAVKVKSLGVRGYTLANCFVQTVQVLCWPLRTLVALKSKALLTSQALPLSEASLYKLAHMQAASFFGFVCKLLLFLGHCFAVKYG